MPWSPYFNDLQRALANLYPTSADARRLAAQAGLQLELVDFNGHALNIWYNIIEIAERQNKVDSVIEQAITEYSDNTKLVTALQTYRIGLEQDKLSKDQVLQHSTLSDKTTSTQFQTTKNNWLLITTILVSIVVVGYLGLSSIGFLQTYIQLRVPTPPLVATGQSIVTATNQLIDTEITSTRQSLSTVVATQSALTVTIMPPDVFSPTILQRTATLMEKPTAIKTPEPTYTFILTSSPTFTPTSPLVAGEKRTIKVAGVEFSFVYVPAGTFTMGVTGDVGANTAHKVTLKAFWIGLTEVTNEQYRLFVEAGGYTQKDLWTEAGWGWRQVKFIEQVLLPELLTDCGDAETLSQSDHPMVCVNWYEAMAYANWLAKETGEDVRLPSEAEWERSARGDDGRTYPWGNDEPNDHLLNYNQNIGKTTAVGSYPNGKSPYGALDMAGNVWEWTSSLAKDYPYRPTDGRENLEGPTCCLEQTFRVRRGGSWYDGATGVRSVTRDGLPALISEQRKPILQFVGVRLVISAPP